MISARLPSEALVQLGQLQLSHLHPPPAMTPEFLAPPPRPYPRYPTRRREVPPYSPVPGAYAHFLPQPNFPYLYPRPRPSYPLRPRPTSGFVPPPPAPHSPSTPPLPVPVAPAPQAIREEPPLSPERGAPAPYFCRGALIRLENGTLRRVEEMRTEDFAMSAEHNGDLALTQCTLLRLEERGDKIALVLAYDRNRSQVELESTAEHPFFVYGRGWASFKPERTLARYGLHVPRLQVGDVCVTLVERKHTTSAPMPPQTQPENLSVKEDARKRRWSIADEEPPLKKR
ncbi:ataxin-1 [Aricia agestis]|uniref:ataxin-1 n=1 Tax=Aricia agestis TaxID=91739 RepID=UPI001C20B198|nr:ataxin-1 [Aricia agestis]XP_041987185.1 ataxin-1 [Aricia agestis]